MPLMKRWALNILLIGASVLAMLLLAEIALHFSPLKLKYLYPLEPQGYLRHDPELGFDIVPNFATSTHAFTDLSYPVWSNSLGCFDHEYDGNEPYIYITGDSFTWGFTPYEDKWGKLVEHNLGIRALTCGVNAFGPRAELIKTRRDLERLSRPPELIIVGYFEGNDFGDDKAPNFTAYKGYRVPVESRCSPEEMAKISPLAATTTCAVSLPHYTFLQKLKFELSRQSVLYMIAQRAGVQDAIKRKLGLRGTEWPAITNDDEAWSTHERVLNDFKTLARQHGTQVVFVLIPDREMVRASTTPDVASVHERVKQVLSRNQIPYIDLLPAFRAGEQAGEKYFWPINEHWNVEGNRLAGEIVSMCLKGLKLPPSGGVLTC